MALVRSLLMFMFIIGSLQTLLSKLTNWLKWEWLISFLVKLNRNRGGSYWWRKKRKRKNNFYSMSTKSHFWVISMDNLGTSLSVKIGPWCPIILDSACYTVCCTPKQLAYRIYGHQSSRLLGLLTLPLSLGSNWSQEMFKVWQHSVTSKNRDWKLLEFSFNQVKLLYISDNN